jgi:hypothetical protein
VSPTEAYSNQPIQLLAEATGRPPLDYLWKLPNGSVLSGNPVEIPPGSLSPTSATVRLTVSNDAGSAMRTITPRVLSPFPKVRSVSLVPTPTYPKTEITATAVATGTPTLTYRWTFPPDGKVLEGATVRWEVPDLPPGSYIVGLEVSNAAGKASSRATLRVLRDVALRYFEPFCSGPCIFSVNRPVSFGLSTSTPNLPVEIDWTGDGIFDETVTSSSPFHIYTKKGTFRPKARVRLPDGRLETRFSSRIITIVP